LLESSLRKFTVDSRNHDMHWRSSTLVIALTLLLTESAALGEEFRALFDQATLSARKLGLPRSRVVTAWQTGVRHGTRQYQIKGDLIVQTDAETHQKSGKPAFAPDGASLRWFGAADDIAFLGAERKDDPRSMTRNGRLLSTIRRLDLNTMEWLTPLDARPHAPQDDEALAQREAAAQQKWDAFVGRLGAGALSAPIGRTSSLCKVLVDARGVVALSILSVGNHFPPLGCQVTWFNPGEDEPAWGKWIDWIENSRPREFVPGYGGTSINSLTRVEEGILVCVPGSQDLVCFDEKGGPVWNLSRIWEFEGLYSTPDMFFDRFGVEVQEDIIAGTPAGHDPVAAEAARKAAQAAIDDEIRKAKELRALRSERFYKDYQAWIMAGPILVNPLDSERDDTRLFVTVCKMRNPDLVNHNTAAPESTILEIDGYGSIHGLTKLPTMIDSPRHFSIRGGLIWEGRRGSLARLATSESQFARGLSGSDDMECRVEWYRELRDTIDEAWDLRNSGADSRPACVAGDKLFRCLFLPKRNDADHVICFRISAVDLDTGLNSDLILKLPFEGQVPKTAAQHAVEDAGCNQGFGGRAFEIEIVELETDGTALRVVIKAGDVQTAVEFDVRAIIQTAGSE
jgi:hypothetical protein